jgi:catechol 2,3-dioxygenase-like lactoylglutathione lyase family enzyme
MAARRKARSQSGAKARSASKARPRQQAKPGQQAKSGAGPGAAPSQGTVVGLGGVFFKASDTGRSLAFYRALGLPFGEAPYLTWAWDPPGPRRKGAPPGVTVFSLFEAGSDYFGDGGQRFMVNLRVAGLDALLERLRAAGVAVLPKVQEEPYGRFAWIVDPDGHRVELWEPRDVPGFEGVPMR